MILKDKALSMLGLAMRAGKVCTGEFTVESAVKKGRAVLLILARDASEATKKSYTDMCRYYDVPLILYGTKESLGHWCGKEYRAAAALTDPGMAKRIRELIEETEVKN